MSEQLYRVTYTYTASYIVSKGIFDIVRSDIVDDVKHCADVYNDIEVAPQSEGAVPDECYMDLVNELARDYPYQEVCEKCGAVYTEQQDKAEDARLSCGHYPDDLCIYEKGQAR
jgi:hypothetical protein